MLTSEIADWRSPLVALGRRAVVPPSAQVLMQDAASVAAELLGADYYGIVSVSADGPWNFFVYPNGAESKTNDLGVDLSSCDETNCPEFKAMKDALPLAVYDLGSQKEYASVRLTRHQIGSMLIVPLVHAMKCFGTIGVYCKNSRAFKEEDCQAFESIGHLVTATLARVEYQEKLKHQGEKWRASIDTMEALQVTLTPDGQIVDCNRACLELTGFCADDLVDRDIYSSFLEPGDLQALRDALMSVSHKESRQCETNLLTKHGEQYRVRWTLSTFKPDDKESRLVVATGIDITEQIELEKKLQKALGDGFQSEGTEAPEEERRKRVRTSYPYVQLVAPMPGDEFPSLTEFQETECCDISGTGFSFLTEEVPTQSRIVVAFGTHPSLTYVIADIRHSTPVVIDGREMFRNGCCYQRRLTT